MRVAISGIAGFAAVERLSRLTASDQVLLGLAGVAGGIAHVVHRIAGGLELDALQVAGKEAAAPLAR